MNIEKFLDEYLGTRSEDSRKGYRGDLNRFRSYLDQTNLAIKAVQPCHIKHFALWLKGLPNFKTKMIGLSDSTVQRHLAAVRSFYRWLQYYCPTLRNPAALYKFHRTEDAREVTAVEPEVATAMCSGSASKRDIAMVQLFRRSGIRLRELVRMNRDSIRIHEQMDGSGIACVYGSASVYGKGRKTRTVLVHEIALNALADYLEERGEDNEPALFISTVGPRRRISRRTVQRVIWGMAKNVGAVHVHPHMLRHSFGTEMLNAGMQDVVLQKLMGHKHLRTTLGYAKISDSNALRQYHAAMELIQKKTNSNT